MKPKYMLLCLVLMLSFSVSVSASSNESSLQPEIGVVEKLLIRLVDGEQIGALDQNGTDVRDQLKQLHDNGLSVQELFQIIVDDSLVLVDMTVPASITPSTNILLKSTRLVTNPFIITVKMYYAYEYGYVLKAIESPYTQVQMQVRYYTYASFHYVTRVVTWSDRPYVEKAPGTSVIGDGIISSGLGGATRTVNGSDVLYKNSWVEPKITWYCSTDGYSYCPPSLRFPKVYYPYENLFTPHLWWNGIVQ